jgi:rubrerythrin
MPDVFYPDIIQPADATPSWKCSRCNFVFKGDEPPKVCPLCHKEAEFDAVRDYREFTYLEVD